MKGFSGEKKIGWIVRLWQEQSVVVGRGQEPTCIFREGYNRYRVRVNARHAPQARREAHPATRSSSPSLTLTATINCIVVYKPTLVDVYPERLSLVCLLEHCDIIPPKSSECISFLTNLDEYASPERLSRCLCKLVKFYILLPWHEYSVARWDHLVVI